MGSLTGFLIAYAAAFTTIATVLLMSALAGSGRSVVQQVNPTPVRVVRDGGQDQRRAA